MTPSEIETVSLKEHFTLALSALDRRVTELSEAALRAGTLAAEAQNAKLASMNELRGAMNDLATHAATRDQLDALKEKVNEVKVQVAVVAALVSLLVSVLVVIVSRWIMPP